MQKLLSLKFDLTHRDAPLIAALVASLFLHLGGFVLYKVGKAHQWWEMTLPFLDRVSSKLSQMMVNQERVEALLDERRQSELDQIPLMYIDVLPSQATEETPEDAKFYSAMNSLAANPDADVESNVPRVDGSQTRIAKTVDIPIPMTETVPAAVKPPSEEEAPEIPEPEPSTFDPDRLQPAPPEETTVVEEPEPAVEPKETPPVGVDEPTRFAMADPVRPGETEKREAKPSAAKGETDEPPTPPPPPSRNEPRRPRTLAEARALQPQTRATAGERMKQEGGVRRRGIQASFDTRATPFGTYDSMLISAIQQRWWYLLDTQEHARNWAGYVVVKFHLYYDGRVTELEIEKNISGELQGVLCQKAIYDNAPFPRWPSDLRNMTNKDYRELRFTFYYN